MPAKFKSIWVNEEDSPFDPSLSELIRFNKDISDIEQKTNSLLFWANTAVTISFILLALTLRHIYSGFIHKDNADLDGVFTIILAAYIFNLFLVWRKMKRAYHSTLSAAKDFMLFWRRKVNCQLHMVYVYLVTYTAIILIASCFFYDSHLQNWFFVLRITLPVSLAAYGCGITFIFKLKAQYRKIKDLLHTLITNEN